MSGYTPADHTWVICAYRESPYLEACIRSVREQTVRSNVRMVTATPGPYIEGLAERYGIPLTVNHGKAGIAGDWNFALRTGGTELTTIAHQDDLYEPGYCERMLARLNRTKNPRLFFTNYAEIRNGEKVTSNRLLRIKRLLLLPVRLFPGWRKARRLSLGLGNAICCPSVTYIRSAMGELVFGDRFKSNLDWEMTERLSRRKGRFVYEPACLMAHRIHGESTTTEIIGDHQRTLEDYEMMRKFWPEPVARRLSRVYAASEKSNQVAPEKGGRKG